jgi:hypothetical protein
VTSERRGPPTLYPGDLLERRYEIEAQVGAGGMARVFRVSVACTPREGTAGHSPPLPGGGHVTPKWRVMWKPGGGTRAHSRAMNLSGLMSAWAAPLRQSRGRAPDLDEDAEIDFKGKAKGGHPRVVASKSTEA